MPLIYWALAWVAGIYGGWQLALPPLLLLWAVAVLGLSLLLVPRHRAIIVAGLCLVALLLGWLRGGDASLTSPGGIAAYNGRGLMEVEGVVSEAPQAGDRSLSLRLQAQRVRAEGRWQPTSGGLLVHLPRYPAYAYGDLLRLRGELESPPPPGGLRL